MELLFFKSVRMEEGISILVDFYKYFYNIDKKSFIYALDNIKVYNGGFDIINDIISKTNINNKEVDQIIEKLEVEQYL